jgi:hypothetical protein
MEDPMRSTKTVSSSSEAAHRDSKKTETFSEVFVDDRAEKLGSSLRGTRRGGEEEKIIVRVNSVGTSLSATRGRAAAATTTTTAAESE